MISLLMNLLANRWKIQVITGMELKTRFIPFLFAALAMGVSAAARQGTPSAEGISLWRGRLSTVTSLGGMLNTQQGILWVSSPALWEMALAGDSLLVLGSGRGGFIQPFSMRLKPNGSVFAALRRAYRKRLVETVAEPRGRGLAGGLIMGLRSMIEEDTALVFRESGTSHLLALSGLHTGIVAAFLLLLLRKLLGKGAFSAALAAAGVILFVLLSGARASTVRAGIMAVFAMFYLHSRGGRVHLATVWWGALWVSVLLIPGILADRGAWLSYAAVLSLILLGKNWKGRYGFALSPLYAGVVVTLGTAPLVNALYGGIRPTGPLATVLSIPPMITVMALGAAAPCGFQPVAGLLSLVAGLWLGMLRALSSPPLRLCGRLPWAVWGLSILLLRAISRWNGFNRRFR